MIWKDVGYLLKINSFSENSSIATFLTSNHGLHNGVIYGATSKSKKKYLQIGNLFVLNWKSKSEDLLGYYTVELKKALSSQFFDEAKKLNLILSLAELCHKLLAERYEYNDFFKYTDYFLSHLSENDSLKLYIEWEQELLKSIGFEIIPNNKNFNFYQNDSLEWFFEIDGKKFQYPNFLIDSSADYDDRDLYRALVINKFIMKKFIFEPNKIKFPDVRERIEKKLNEVKKY